MPDLPERPSARLLLHNPAQNTFLFLRVEDPNLSVQAGVGCACWVTLGGGVEPGETFEQAAVRELWEETGLVAGKEAIIGDRVKERRIALQFGTGESARQLLSVESYFAVTLLTTPDVICDTNLEDYERAFIQCYRWWTITEMRAAIANKTDAFFPDDLVDDLAKLVNAPSPNPSPALQERGASKA